MDTNHEYTGLEIAVIGMSGRFPGAHNLQEFWDNISQGIDAITHFSDEELLEQGVAPELIKKANYVKAKGLFPDVEYFDYDFFKYTPKDALNMDPQVRALHQEVYLALEDAGYSSEQYRGSIGLIVGASGNFKWEAQVLNEAAQNGESSFAAAQLCDKDFAATRIAYALNLKGPCYTLHSACSSSLLAIDMACKSLLTGACKIAVAGGSSISLPHVKGYEYVKGMIYSPDGYCRAFDETAQGTVEGNGAGVVVLKNLDQAIKDGDHIYAVIKGIASNNDGNRKVGFTAPSVEGQTEVIRKALSYAEVEANSIGYVETHGTGTELGDPIEFDGLVQAFRGSEKNHCALGFVKAGIGHLDTAAGVAAFEKTVLALDNKKIPKSIHFESPNPYINVDSSPFYFCKETKTWERQLVDEMVLPLRAGISSFGMGGTNVHAILEEAPVQQRGDAGRKQKLFILAGNSEETIRTMQKEYVHFLQNSDQDMSMDDLVWSLQTKQRSLKYRYTTVFSEKNELIEKLNESIENEELHLKKVENKHIYFMFAGQGTQYPGMAKGLYETEPFFREALDECIEIAEENGVSDLRELLLVEDEAYRERLTQTQVAQVALFAVEYSLATMLMKWKIEPEAMIGHSLGEFVAATIAGVFSLEDGMKVVIARGKYMQQMKKGVMLGVTASKEEIEPLLGDKVQIAAINTDSRMTVAGENDAIESFAKRCEEKGIQVQKLHTSHAFHSYMMQDAVEPFRKTLETVEKYTPQIPFISNLTGDWITAEQVYSSEYYASQLVNSVQFYDGSRKMIEENAIVIEIGLGNVLSTFVRNNCKEKDVAVIHLLPNAKDKTPADLFFTRQLGKVWEAGAVVSWHRYDYRAHKQRMVLPLYAFDKTEVSIETSEMSASVPARMTRRQSVRKQESQYYTFGWKKTIYPKCEEANVQNTFLLITDSLALQNVLTAVPRQRVIVAQRSDHYAYGKNKCSMITKGSFADLRQLFFDLERDAMIPKKVVYYAKDSKELVKEAHTVLTIASQYGNEIEDCIFISTEEDEKKVYHNAMYINSLNLLFENVRCRLFLFTNNGADRKQSQNLLQVLNREIYTETQEDDNVVRYVCDDRYILAPLEQPVEVGKGQEKNKHLIVVEDQKLPQVVRMLEKNTEDLDIAFVTYSQGKEVAFAREELENALLLLRTKEEACFQKAGLGNNNLCYQLAEEYVAFQMVHLLKEKIHLEVGQIISKEEWYRSFNVTEGLKKYLDYLAQILKKYQVIKEQEQGYVVTEGILQNKNVYELRERILEKTEALEADIEQFDFAFMHLEDVLCGKKVASDVLKHQIALKGKKTKSLEQKETEYLYDLFAESLRSLTKEKKRIRILELGNGDEQLSKKIAQLLQGVEIEYFYTDRDNKSLETFMRQAVKEKWSNIKYSICDLEKSLIEQGIEAEGFDIVLTNGVMYTASSIRQSLEYILAALKPGGLIGMFERTTARNYVDLVKGMDESWWEFDETERNQAPVLDFAHWKEFLLNAGLEEINMLPSKRNLSECLNKTLILGMKRPEYEVLETVHGYQGEKGRYVITNHLNLKKEPCNVKEEVSKFLDWNTDCDSVVLVDYGNMPEQFWATSNMRLQSEDHIFQLCKDEIYQETRLREIPFGVVSIIGTDSSLGSQVVLNQKEDSLRKTNRIYIKEKDFTDSTLDYVDEMIRSNIGVSMFTNDNLMKFFKTQKNLVEEEQKVDHLEAYLQTEWKKILGISEIKLDDDFFEIGGDSFKLIQLTNNLEKKGYAILVNEFYSYPTIRKLADYLRKNGAKDGQILKEETQIQAFIQERYEEESEFISIQKGEEEKRVLVVDTDRDSNEILQALMEQEIDHSVFPDYVVNKRNGRDAVKLYEETLSKQMPSEQMEKYLKKHISEQNRMSEELCHENELYRYPISNMQRIHFKGDTRLQMYLIEMKQPLDIEVFNKAFLDVIVAHGFFRSCLCGLRLNQWSEKEAPNVFQLPLLDISKYSKRAQEKMVEKIVAWENTVDFKRRKQLMYHVTLIKYSEKKYDLLFEFDHSIFDLFSGQLIRMQLIRRYEELRQKSYSAMEISCNYKSYMDQIRKGPLGITPEELKQKFEIGAYGTAFSNIQEKISSKRMEKNKHVAYTVDVNEIDGYDTDSMLELAIALSGMTLAELLGVDTVAIDLLFQNRQYGKLKYNDVMGMAIDGIPLVFDISEDSFGQMREKLTTKISDISKYNINFFNLVCDMKSFLKWGRIMQEVNQASDSKMFASCLINFAGNVEEEYSRIWEYSSDEGEDSNLNYADYYVAVKSVGTKLEFHIICSFEKDVKRIENVMEKQVNILKNINIDEKIAVNQ